MLSRLPVFLQVKKIIASCVGRERLCVGAGWGIQGSQPLDSQGLLPDRLSAPFRRLSSRQQQSLAASRGFLILSLSRLPLSQSLLAFSTVLSSADFLLHSAISQRLGCFLLSLLKRLYRVSSFCWGALASGSFPNTANFTDDLKPTDAWGSIDEGA